MDDVLLYNRALSASEIAALGGSAGEHAADAGPDRQQERAGGDAARLHRDRERSRRGRHACRSASLPAAAGRCPRVLRSRPAARSPGLRLPARSGPRPSTCASATAPPRTARRSPSPSPQPAAIWCSSVPVTSPAATRTQDSDTAALVSGIPGNVFTIGDNAYETGTAAEFGCYNDTWGAFKARTRPAAGNHDFGNGATPGATPYFDYFNGVGNQTGPAGDRALGYYSYDIGTGPNTWHVVVLNSECEPSTGYWLPGGCAAGSAQDLWLKNDLAQRVDEQHHRDLAQAALVVLGKPCAHAAAVAGPLRRRRRHPARRPLAQLRASRADGRERRRRSELRRPPVRRRHRWRRAVGLRHDPADERGAQLEHLRRDQVHAPRRRATTGSSSRSPARRSPTREPRRCTRAPGSTPRTFTTIPVTDSTGEKPQSKLWQYTGPGGPCCPRRPCRLRARGSGVSTPTTRGATSSRSPTTPTCRPMPRPSAA